METVRQILTESWSRPLLETSFVRLDATSFGGYVVDPNDLTRVFTIDILIDGTRARTAFANEFVQELSKRQLGDGCFGFSMSFNSDFIHNAEIVEARLSNLGIAVGVPIILTRAEITADLLEVPGSARWIGGLRFVGWVGGESATAPVLDVLVDGALVSRVKALGWTHQ